MYKKVFLLANCIGLVFCKSFPITIGSDTDLTIFTVQQIANNEDFFGRAGLFNGGIGIQNNGDNATFNSLFPVSGTIDLRNGVLVLRADLQTNNVCTFNTLGTIVGNDHSLILARSIDTIPVVPSGQPVGIVDLNIVCNGNISFGNVDITFFGNSVISGQDNIITLDATTQLRVDANSTLTIQNAILQDLDGTNIILQAATSTLILQDCVIVLGDDFNFSQGSIQIKESVAIEGANNQFAFTSAGTLQIDKNSLFVVGQDVEFLYNPSSSASNLLQCSDGTSVFMLENSTLNTAKALVLTGGEFRVDGRSNITTTVNGSPGVTFGDGTDAANNMEIHVVQGATLEVGAGVVVYDNI